MLWQIQQTTNWWYFNFFQKIGCDISCKLSSNVKSYFLWKNKNKFSKCILNFLPRMLSINTGFTKQKQVCSVYIKHERPRLVCPFTMSDQVLVLWQCIIYYAAVLGGQWRSWSNCGQSDITLDKNVFLDTVNVLKFHTPKVLTKWHIQTLQTQIRLLLQKHIQGLPVCLTTTYHKKQLHKKQNLAESME